MNSVTDSDPDVQAFALLKELVALTAERWINAARFTALAQTWVLGDVSAQVRFLTQIKAVLRSMPVQTFQDSDSRLAALNALQDALDALIEQEEAGDTSVLP